MPRNSAPLGRIARLLDAVSVAEDGIRLGEICVETGIPRSTTYRLVSQLVKVGFLNLSTNGNTVRIGSQLVKFTLRGATPHDFESALAPLMTQLADEIEKAVFVARLSGYGVRLISVFPPSRPEVSFISPGRGWRPVHACSSAKAILAFQQVSFVEQAIAEGLPSYTPMTIRDRGEYFIELERVRKRGWATCREEIESSVQSFAVPVHIGEGQVEMSIGAADLISRFDAMGLDRAVAATRSAALALERKLIWQKYTKGNAHVSD